MTVPIAPLLNAMRFCDAVGLNPKPLIVTVFAVADWLTVLLVTTGRELAT